MSVCFLFFEKANFDTVEPLARRLLERGVAAIAVKGFDYKELTGQISPLRIPPEIPSLDLWESCRAWDAPPEGGRQPPPEPTLDGLLESFFARPEIPFLEHAHARMEAATRAYLREASPALVVLPEDTDYIRGRLAARICRELAIPAAVILPVYYNTQLRYPLGGSRLAARYLVLNERVKARLCRAGARPECVHVVGHPRFAAWGRREDEISAPLLYLMQSLEWEEQIVTDLVEIFERRPQARLWLKPHPESADRSLPKLPPNAAILRGGEADPISRAACIVAQSSQGLYHALFRGTPCFTVNYGSYPAEIDLPPDLACARGRADLESLVDRALRQELPSPDLSGFLPPSGTDPVEAALELLVDMLPRR